MSAFLIPKQFFKIKTGNNCFIDNKERNEI